MFICGNPWAALGSVLRSISVSTRMSVSISRRPSPGRRVRGELVADAQPGQDAVDLVVGVHRPRQRIGGFMAVQHQALNAVLRPTASRR